MLLSPALTLAALSPLTIEAATTPGSASRVTDCVVASACGDICGNGAPDDGEECDDGNDDDGDGCSASCDVEPGFTCTPALPGGEESALGDSSFELGGLQFGEPNPFWTETFTPDSSPPICNPNCGVDLARTGDFFVWNGGGSDVLGTAQTQTITQTATIPTSADGLDLFTLRGICNSGLTDNLRVEIDGNSVFTLTCDATELDYVHQTVDLAAAPGGPYNDGETHTVALVATTTATDTTPPDLDFTNIFVDDVSIGTGTLFPPTPSRCREVCYSENFDAQGGGGDLTGWTVFNTGVLDVDWGTTDDGICGSSGNFPPGNYTGGTGEAACVDSDQAGPGTVDAFLCSPLIHYGDLVDPFLQLFVNYQTFPPSTPEDLFEILTGTTPPGPGTIGEYESVFATGDNLGFFVGPGTVVSRTIEPRDGYLCVHYAADFDWYAMVDDISISAQSCTAAGDSDGDGVPNGTDNCTQAVNPSQLDTDADGIGNQCDGDFNEDCSVNFVDLGELKSEFFSTGDLEEDMSGDGVVNFVDLGLVKADFFLTPGPGAPGNICDR